MAKLQYSPTPTDENELHKPDQSQKEIPGEFPEIDKFGPYTVTIFFLLSLPLILSASRSMSYAFTTGTMSYRCSVKECEDPANTTLHPSWLSNAVPYTNDEPELCTRFVVKNSTDSCETTKFSTETEQCDEWIYEPHESSILNEFNLTCSNNLWKLTLPGSINNLGQFIGMIFTGYLSDRFGRRNLLAVSTVISAILGLIRSFSVNYEMFVIFEFLDAMAGSGVWGAMFVLGMEFVGPEKRIVLGNLPACLAVIWYILLGAFAMWLRSWRNLLRVFYAPGLLAIFIPYLVPESVRWLLSRGRVEEAEEVLRKIASGNRIPISEKSIQLLRSEKKEIIHSLDSKSKASRISVAREIIRNKTLFIRLVVCTFCWLANVFVYYGLCLRSVAVPGDKYINFMLTATVELPAQFLVWILADFVGRKPTLSGSFFLSGVFCILTVYVPAGTWNLPLIIFLSGKFCITMSYRMVYIFTTEMFPTPLRNSLLSFCSMIGRIGSMIAPQTPLLARIMPSLPLLSFGVVAISASFLSLILPETLGVKLPDTVSEAARIGEAKQRKSGTRIVRNVDEKM
ncbi:solute carrier family 22 member 5-like [Athalia rosae]|uniref:solute carrier family 22 member 5-like n=1 Tax=Athalia rosae TaxID=37344 RepID=UPI0020333150|nr:solute carrier family 22 member 5-like [Athalia rosae]